jgi:hypothetical protein
MLINIADIVDGALVNAIALTGRRVSVAVDGLHGRRGASDLTTARWFETYRLTSESPEIPGSSTALTERLAGILQGDEVQAALQELLAARLTDAPETDAASARQALVLTLGADALEVAEALAGYYDDQICALVARLEADDPPLLAQIRSEAFSARMINVLNAIERHTAALSARPARRTESSFLASYRRHAIDQHGKLEPPDFDRRRRVPIKDIYVPTGITEDLSTERVLVARPADEPSLTLYDLADRLDRTVLLGEPGGGKTTAANVLMHHFALDAVGRVPFLVTLRDYAAQDPPERSVAGHVERTLETFYQCPAPAGLVNLLLLTGRALVIFDGLDELLETSRRADVTTRVEHFCTEYPLAPVLVTSRVVGYDQARLNDHEFTCYRLGVFGDEQVAEYARKWFAQDPGASADEAQAFLAESENIPDLRSNPLLLSLMCILYRGEGSLPRDRAGVYAQCANLLFHRWDARRHIHQELRAGHLLEPALRHIAWWLFTRDEARAAVTEDQLIAETTSFLYGRGFESEEAAREAAREFVEFCCGRMWVFSDAGTTAVGQKLYAFTHRTFLEYFAAAELAYRSDTPERLARTLAPHVARGEWEVVGELAVQIKDGTSSAGARRVYEELLGERRRRTPNGRSGILQFLARTLRSVDPPPETVRALTREILHFLVSGDLNSPTRGLPIAWLLASCDACLPIVDDEISNFAATLISSGDRANHLDGLRLAVSLNVPLRSIGQARGPEVPPGHRLESFWRNRSAENATTYTDAIIAAAMDHQGIRYAALYQDIMTAEQALGMTDGLLSLIRNPELGAFQLTYWPYLIGKFLNLVHNEDDPTAIRDLTAVGRYLRDHPQLPWVKGRANGWSYYRWDMKVNPADGTIRLDPLVHLGVTGASLILAEIDETKPERSLSDGPPRFGPFDYLHSYIECRYSKRRDLQLPELPVTDEFKQTFRDWARGRVNLTAPD